MNHNCEHCDAYVHPVLKNQTPHPYWAATLVALARGRHRLEEAGDHVPEVGVDLYGASALCIAEIVDSSACVSYQH